MLTVLGIVLTAVRPGLFQGLDDCVAGSSVTTESAPLPKTAMKLGMASHWPRTTPGPRIIVVAFVCFLAGYNHLHGSLWMGALGLLATTFYTFLPCFFFVFAGAPLVKRTQDKPRIRNVLRLISAVVVGAIGDLTLFLGKAVIFPTGVVGLKQLNATSLAGVMLPLPPLQRFKLKMIPVIPLGIGFGSMRYFLGW